MWTERQIKRTLSQGFRVARGQALLRTGDVALRTALADTLCSEFDFHDAAASPVGRLFEGATGPGAGGPAHAAACAGSGGAGVPRSGPAVTVLEGLKHVRVDDAEHRAIWNEWMAREHHSHNLVHRDR